MEVMIDIIEAGAAVNVKAEDGVTVLTSLVRALIFARLSKQKRTKRLFLLFRAGVDLSLAPKKYLKKAIPESELSLKNICREAIRNHLLQMNDVNLFYRVPRLGLPSRLNDYLLYDQTLDDDDDDKDDDDDDDPHHHSYSADDEYYD